MKYSIDKEPKYILLKFHEERLDATVSPEVKATFISLNAEGMRNLVLDLSEVKYVDSSGLSALLIANRLCSDAGGSLILAALTDHVMKLIKISQLEKVLTLLPTVEEAVEHIFMTELENDLRAGQEDVEDE
ncbi:STAS domain-containing protein [Eisenibacter elegans]|jgi:anti-anti-sigma factor|uniref:STAS domain-containing protein n=1 Tax=Eisenibacter elegans TaxID=997 RepID=UPI000429563D|nr:STAS domain-containing protein [Eisenibacter elegans]